MSIPSALAQVAETIAVWLDPKRRETAILREAIDSAEQLLMVIRKQGRYATFSDKKLKAYEIHYQKRFDAWKDGNS